MNDELKTRLVKYLDALEAAGRKGADFVADQAPETIRQFLTWTLVQRAGLCIMFAVLAAVALYIASKFWRWAQEAKAENEWESQFNCELGLTCFGLATTGLGIGSLVSLFGALKVWIAPNVFLIEWAAELVKGTR